MATTLEDLITAQRAQADIQTLQATQSQKEGEAALNTEGAEINPLYDKLIGETQQAYQGNLENARNSASASGVYRSGIRYNKELALGSAAAKQTGEYGAERTRKLADISRRRTLLAEKSKLTAQEIQAGLGSSIADLRYKDWQQQEAMRLEREKMAQTERIAAANRAATASSSDKFDKMNIGRQLAEDIAAAKEGGANKEQTFDRLIKTYEGYGYDGNSLMNTIRGYYDGGTPVAESGGGDIGRAIGSIGNWAAPAVQRTANNIFGLNGAIVGGLYNQLTRKK